MKQKKHVLFALLLLIVPLTGQAQSTASKSTSDTDVLGHLVNDIQTKSSQSTDQSFELNSANQALAEATTSSDAQLMRAKQHVNSAALDAQTNQGETVTRANENTRNETWGATITDGIQTGIDSGAAGIGAAIASGLNASSKSDK